jgi:hypothetical protein
MTDTLNGQLIIALTAWALLWLTAAAVGLYARPREWWRGFWFMSALWAAIDGAIAWWGLVNPPLSPAELAPILLVNIGLGVGYLLGAALLLTRRTPLLKGFGGAVLVQGLYLLVQDSYFYLRATAPGS